MADDSRKQLRGRAKTCPVCGREFWCYDPVLWAYREHGNHKSARHICSWSCQAKYNAELEAKRNAKPEAKQAKYKARLEAKRLERLEAQQAKYNARLEAKRLERLEAKRRETKPPADAEPNPPKRATNRTPTEWHLLEGLADVMIKARESDVGLAGRTGVCRQSIAAYRGLKRRCKAQKAQILADALGVTLEDLLTKKEDTV